MEGLVLIHAGCGGRYHEGFINTDKYTVSPRGKPYTLDKVMDLAQPWPFKDRSVDGIVSMHVFQQMTWRELLVAFREAYRVLKKGGVMRMGCPMIDDMSWSIDRALGWKNINLFSFDLLKRVLVDRMGFACIKLCERFEEFVVGFAKTIEGKAASTEYCLSGLVKFRFPASSIP